MTTEIYSQLYNSYSASLRTYKKDRGFSPSADQIKIMSFIHTDLKEWSLFPSFLYIKTPNLQKCKVVLNTIIEIYLHAIVTDYSNVSAIHKVMQFTLLMLLMTFQSIQKVLLLSIVKRKLHRPREKKNDKYKLFF